MSFTDNKKKKVTFDDIAKYTGFSKTTISRYFNSPDTLTLDNQKIISNALIELDYKENKVARILANGKTEFIGVIVPNLQNHYYSEMLNQILQTYGRFGYKFLVFVGNEQEETERQYIQELLAYNIEGLIVMSFTLPSAELAKLPIPVVAIEREDRFVSSVNTDNYMGGVQATSLLARHNCDILIHINTTDTTSERPAYGRIRGFLDICEEKKLNHRLLYVSPGNTFEEMQESLSEVVQELDTAYAGMRKGIFVSGDTRANIFLNLLIRKHGSLPDDYRIIGFDDSPISREAVIPISTVGQQIEKMAFEAVSMLVEQMNERKKRRPVLLQEPVHRVLAPVLIRRETTEKGEQTVIN